MLSRTVAIAGLLIVLVGCAQVRTQRTQAGREGERSASASIFVTDEPPADVALIVCERDAVKLKDQVVRTERHGVHLLIDAPGAPRVLDQEVDSMSRTRGAPGASISTTSHGRTAARKGSS